MNEKKYNDYNNPGRRVSDQRGERHSDPQMGVMQAQIHEIGNKVSELAGGSKSTFEKHTQTVFGAIAILLLGWFGMSVTDSREEIVRLSQATRSMDGRISELKSEIKDAVSTNYTKSDAIKDIDLVMGAVNKMEHRVDKLETLYERVLLDHHKIMNGTSHDHPPEMKNR